jgi:hypothetical protein
MQFPLQAVSQQKPSAQKPEAHCVFWVQRRPLLTWQRPVGSQYVPTQSESLAQLCRQAPASGSQVYGAQMTVGPVRQAPAPLHTS